jgi:hypothetical protein
VFIPSLLTRFPRAAERGAGRLPRGQFAEETGMRVVRGKLRRDHRARVAREWIFYPKNMPERWRMLARRISAALPHTVASDEERYGRAAALACCLFAELGALPEDMREEFWGSMMVWRDEIVPAVTAANRPRRTPLNSTSPYDDEESASL